jgi:hypothetical protein
MTKKKSKSGSKGSTRRTAQEKLRLVLEASGLSEEELGAFLRREGVHEAELGAWRAKALEAAEGALKAPHGKRSKNTAERRKIRDLERELRNKDKALAEVSALLILKKKALLQFEWVTCGADSFLPAPAGGCGAERKESDLWRFDGHEN